MFLKSDMNFIVGSLTLVGYIGVPLLALIYFEESILHMVLFAIIYYLWMVCIIHNDIDRLYNILFYSDEDLFDKNTKINILKNIYNSCLKWFIAYFVILTTEFCFLRIEILRKSLSIQDFSWKILFKRSFLYIFIFFISNISWHFIKMLKTNFDNLRGDKIIQHKILLMIISIFHPCVGLKTYMQKFKSEHY
jgi:hypothetical protein